MWTATSEEDCPESRVRLGPTSPNRCETRLAIMPRCSPVKECLVMLSAPYWFSSAS